MEWLQFTLLIIALIGMHKENSNQMKDFHGRLCKLEEKYQNMMERILTKK